MHFPPIKPAQILRTHTTHGVQTDMQRLFWREKERGESRSQILLLCAPTLLSARERERRNIKSIAFPPPSKKYHLKQSSKFNQIRLKSQTNLSITLEKFL